MKIRTKKSLSIAATLGVWTVVSGNAQAAVIGNYQFNVATDTEGWSANNTTGLTADGDSLNGTASNNDPQLLLNPAGLTTTGTWTTFEFRVRETQDESPAGVVSSFDPTGLILIVDGSNLTSNGFVGVDSGDGFFTVTIDISSLGSAGISNIRLDPIGGAASNSNSQTQDNTFEIDYIQINDDTVIPEPSSLALMGLGVLAMVRRRR